MLTEQQLKAIEVRAEAACPGPWTIEETKHGELEVFAGIYHVATVAEDEVEFVAHVREDVPILIAEIRRLQAVIEHLQKRSHPSTRFPDFPKGGEE
jgi:hypothetical protein